MTPLATNSDAERFRSVVSERFGLRYDDGKLEFLTDVLRERMSASRCARFDAYLELLDTSPRSRDELRALAEQLTVGETFFFRNADQFRAFTEIALPERLRARAESRRLRILSAGCATGEEPYSIATIVREALPVLEEWDRTIVGLDIHPSALAKAAQARYSAWSLRATPDETTRRYFRADGRDFVLDPEIRKMVAFEERNLVEDDATFWQPQSFDIVFCRNVLMYFEPERMREIIARIGRALVPGGFLFLGHAETLRGVSQDFHLCHTHDTFYYRRKDANDASGSRDDAWTRTGARLANALPEVVESTTSWVDVIQKSSERIATLADERSRTHDGAAGIDPDRAPIARGWDLALVLEAMRQERFTDALALLAELPLEAEGEPDALLLRAVLLTNSGALEDAERVCSQLLALDELNAGAHYVMALCREHAGDAAGAIEHDQTAVYLDPTFAMPHLHVGLLARRAGDPEAARRDLGQALVLLAREDASRLLLFGGGFTRETLVQLCRNELRTIGGAR